MHNRRDVAEMTKAPKSHSHQKRKTILFHLRIATSIAIHPVAANANLRYTQPQTNSEGKRNSGIPEREVIGLIWIVAMGQTGWSRKEELVVDQIGSTVTLKKALSKTMESEVPIVRQQRDSSSSGLFRDSEAWNNDLGNGFRCSNRPLLHLNALDIEIKAENLVKSTFLPIVVSPASILRKKPNIWNPVG
ncbi:hypothetical protein WN48_00243 [Eufriesea mexicana]|uniref:Uncharacterized protein n=1 Tax=Eufriesea mexicana TaxID=516756 RepID=A0A310SC25_9HYME|nr:hypothetical protein WN48_00243 [Eufriesea mexicana]